MIDRNQLVEELKLRKQIRKAIAIVKERRMSDQKAVVAEEKQLRTVIRRLIESDISTKYPEKSTGINYLKTLLKKILTKYETAYKSLVTTQLQRESFRAHVIKGLQELLLPDQVMDKVDTEEDDDDTSITEIDIEITGDEADADAEEAAEEEAFLDLGIETEKEPTEDEKREKFGIEKYADDPTGRDAAIDVIDETENQILDAFNSLGNPIDKDIYVTYLLTNMKLWMDTWESQLKTMVDEPTTPEYEAEAGSDDEKF
jgi:hypothetical protein